MDTTPPRVKKHIWSPAKPIDETLLRRLYATHGSGYAIAKRLGCTHEHVRRHLKKYGIETLKPGEHSLMILKDEGVARDFGVVATWLRTHPFLRLPRSVKGIAEMIGCKPGEVSTYFYRRRKRRLKQLNQLPDLTKLNLTLDDDIGEPHLSTDIATYRYSVERWNLTVTIEATLLTGMVLSFPLPEVEGFVEAVEDALREWTLTHPGVEPPSPPPAIPPGRLKVRGRLCTSRQ